MDIRILQAVKSSRAFKQFEKEMEKETSQTFLFTSDDETMLEAFVTLAECKAYCNDVCLTCNECRKVINKNKYDVIVVNPDDEAFGVREMREKFVNNAYVAAVEGGKKIYVVRKFSELNLSNQNTLLKTLEEPPEKVLIFLTSLSVEGILPTVLSRVSKLPLPPFDKDVLASLLKKMGVANAEDIAVCSRGNLTLALKLSSDDSFITKASELASVLLSVKGSGDVPKYLYSPVFSDLNEALFIIERIFSDLLYLTADLEDNITIRELRYVYDDLKEELDRNAIAAMMEKVNEAEKKLRMNCIIVNVVDDLLLKLAEEKAKCKKLSE